MYALCFSLCAFDKYDDDFLLVYCVKQVPSETFRLGRTRVFFRAGQISTLQRILNETPPEKGPWILKRLQEALDTRLEAKAAAGEANVGNLTKVKALCVEHLSQNVSLKRTLLRS